MKRYEIINRGEDTISIEEAARLLKVCTFDIEMMLQFGELEPYVQHEDWQRVTIASMEKYLSSLRYRITFGSKFADPIPFGATIDSIYGSSQVKRSAFVWETIHEDTPSAKRSSRK
jgi:hypothetical protein